MGPAPVGATTAEGGRRSLDSRTQLLSTPARWRVGVIAGAGEAVISLVTSTDRTPSDERSLVPDEERQRLNHERGNRRARVESWRYMVHNRLRYMWVLTFEEGRHGADGRAEVMQLVAAFIERLRSVTGPLAYWYSPELHPGGHGSHVNLFIARRLKHGDMQMLWEHGFVWVSDWAKHDSVRMEGGSTLDCIRRRRELRMQVRLEGLGRRDARWRGSPL